MNETGENPMKTTRKSRRITRLLLVTALVAVSVPFVDTPPAMAASTAVNFGAQAQWLETQALLEPWGTTNRLDWTSATLIVKSDTAATTITSVEVRYSVRDTGSWESWRTLVNRGTGEPNTSPGGSLNYWTQRSPGASGFNYWTIRTYAEQNGDHGVYCDGIWPYDQTRSMARKVQYRVTMSDSSVLTTSEGALRLNGNGGCSGPEDYPRLTTTSVTSGTPADTAPGGTVSFSFQCDDSDSSGEDVCDRYKWRWRRLNDGALGADSGDISTTGDNKTVNLTATMPNARGRYVIEVRLGNEGGGYPQSEYWRLGEVSVATNSTAANTPVPTVSCPSPIFTGDTYTVTATAGDASADVTGRTQMIEWDTDNDGTYETATRRPTSATPGLTDEATAVSGSDLQRQFTAPGSPGTQAFKVKSWDNGAMAASDTITRTKTKDANCTIRGRPDLEITSSHTGNFTVGMPGGGTYTIGVKNLASAAGAVQSDTAITVTDTLPAGLVPTAASGGPEWSCGISVQTVTCTRSSLSLAPGASAPNITVTVRPEPAALGTKTHSPSVSVAGDNVSGNNSASDSTIVGHSIEGDMLAKIQPAGGTVKNYTVHFELESYPSGSINEHYRVDIIDEDTQTTLYPNEQWLAPGTLWGSPAGISASYNFTDPNNPKVRGVTTGQFSLDGNNGGTSTVKFDVLPIFSTSFTGRIQVKDPQGDPVLPDPPSGTVPYWVYPTFNPTTMDFKAPSAP